MQHRNGWKAALALLVVALAFGVSACSRGQASEEENRAYRDAKVEKVAGTDLSRVTLSQQASDRLGIQTTAVRAQGGQAARKVIAYAAVIYDDNGDTWTFTNPQPLTYLRQQIKIDVVQGNTAVLSDGPAVGTAVVTVGAAELLGTELGVGGE